MSDVEEIQTAIDQLTALKAESDYHEMNGWLAEVVEGASGAIDDPGYAPLTNDPIMVTLYRTIDAQLAILRRERDFGDAHGWPSNPFPERLDVLALARAINGGVS